MKSDYFNWIDLVIDLRAKGFIQVDGDGAPYLLEKGRKEIKNNSKYKEKLERILN